MSRTSILLLSLVLFGSAAWAQADAYLVRLNELTGPALHWRTTHTGWLMASYYAEGKRTRLDSIPMHLVEPHPIATANDGPVVFRCRAEHPRCLKRSDLRQDRSVRTSWLALPIAGSSDMEAFQALTDLLQAHAPLAATATEGLRTNPPVTFND